MADKTYVSYAGFVQFDPQGRDVNGKQVTDITIKTLGGDGKNVKITVWPEFKLETPLERGDFVAVDGSFESSTYQDKDGATQTSYQVSPYKLAVTKGVARTEREVVSGSTSSGSGSSSTVPF